MNYIFGGMALRTDLKFDQLSEMGEHTPRVWLTLDVLDEPVPAGSHVRRLNGRYGLTIGQAESGWVFRSRFPDSFLLDPDRRTVGVHIVSEDRRAWQDILFRRILPLASTLYGATTIHAATVMIDDRCLLLMGRSGAGKSTLTTFCARAGWRVSSDDATVLWIDDRITAEPVQHGTGIWDDACDALNLPHADRVAMPGYGGGKWCYHPAGSRPAEACDVSAIVTLARSTDIDDPLVTPLTREEALRTLVRQRIPDPFSPETAIPTAATAASFGRVAGLARRLPAYRLDYPSGYAALPEVERLLRRMPLADRAT